MHLFNGYYNTKTLIRQVYYATKIRIYTFLSQLFNEKSCYDRTKQGSAKKVGVIFEKVLDFLSLLWYVVVLTEKEAQPMKSMINELWHGNIIPQEDSRTNSKEMKELLGYMSRHHEELEKSFTDEQKETFEKFHDCWSEYMSLAEAAIFEYTFKLGMHIAIETLN